MNRRLTHPPIRMVLVAVLICMTGRATAAELGEVRVGRHADFSRIVFEFKGEVRHYLSRDVESSRLSIVFEDAFSNIPAPAVPEDIACITDITMDRQENNLAVNVAVSTSRFELSPFTIQDPYRVVVDISCSAEATAAPAPSPPAAEPAPPAASAEPAPMPEPSLTPPAPVVAERKPSPPALNVQPAPPGSGNAHQNYLIAILGALSLIIIALAGVIIRQNRTSQAKLSQTAGGARLKQTEEMLSSLDAKIREKLNKHKEH